jgi:spore coat polysaccharide biosynthesis protein SpsF (cytidylyltransferase family)
MAGIAIIVQARMGSTRFPRKIMAPFQPFPDQEPAPVLEWVLRRCRMVPEATRFILATPASNDHAQAWRLAADLGFEAFTASDIPESNVLARYYRAAKSRAERPDHIVRVTADCPLIHPRVMSKVIREHLANGAGYTSNVVERSYPKGFDVEVMTMRTLEESYRNAGQGEREHVTTWARANMRVHNVWQPMKEWRKVNLCVDKAEDPARIRALIARFPAFTHTLREDRGWDDVHGVELDDILFDTLYLIGDQPNGY